MLGIKLVRDHAEEAFLQALDEQGEHGLNRGILLCAFSQFPGKFKATMVSSLLKDMLHDQEGELYFCSDGDLAIAWRGRLNETMGNIIELFTEHYEKTLETFIPETVFHFFDTHAQGNELRRIFTEKLAQHQQLPKDTRPTPSPWENSAAPAVVWKPIISDEQQRLFKKALASRTTRAVPHILIVEDQDFSRRLLVGLFEKNCRCHAAKDAQQAVELYMEHAPDIVFLDIELPDADGHILAALFRAYDPEIYITMVTGNSYVKDVEIAKANAVNGFIVKPYNKLKIMEAFDAFMRRRKETTRRPHAGTR